MATEAWFFAVIAAPKTATLGMEEITVRRHSLPALAAASVVIFAGALAARQSAAPKGTVSPTPADTSKEKHDVPVGRASAGDVPIQQDWDLGRLCGWPWAPRLGEAPGMAGSLLAAAPGWEMEAS